MENLTFTGAKSFWSELNGLKCEAATSPSSQLNDGENACVLRYFELPMPCASFEILCKSDIVSVKRLSADDMPHSASAEKQNEPLRFSFLGRSSRKELLQQMEMRKD